MMVVFAGYVSVLAPDEEQARRQAQRAVDGGNVILTGEQERKTVGYDLGPVTLERA